MRYVAFGFCLMVGCQPATKTAAVPPSNVRAARLFTDSSIYRAQCKEADSLPTLTVIPQKCTPRDQRLIIR